MDKDRYTRESACFFTVLRTCDVLGLVHGMQREHCERKEFVPEYRELESKTNSLSEDAATRPGTSAIYVGQG